ncbi:BC_2427 family protein [Lysinibacillus pakistanensis]|uniref:DUF7852 domain-containing protein n=1 Tax=Lysinibacillus pakistanensis TaxID=759811 RepID=A0ABX6DEV3_9BACI|nr:hypothetical protein GDS87_16225 [Lysinibacillus pakistanensis]
MKTPWINFRGMKEVSSKQNKYTNWTYQTKPSHLDSACGENDDTKKLDDTRNGEESSHELLISSRNNVEEETNPPPDNVEVDELDSVEELDLALLIPLETDIEEEIDHFSDTEIDDEMNPVKDLDLATNLDSNHGLLIPLEINDVEDVHALPDSEETEEMNSVEEPNLTSQVDPNHKIFSQSEYNGENKNDEGENLSTPFPEPVQGEVCSITQKNSFSTYVEINDFLHAPICGENVQNTFEFLDLNNKLIPQFETKLFHTITDYPEQPDCRLARSKINKIVFLMKTDIHSKNNQKNNLLKSVVVPLHNSQSINKGGVNNHSYSTEDFMHIRVPVVVGEYKIEICLEEFIIFEKGIVEVKDISSEVVLTNCRFVPNRFSKSLGNGTCIALNGNLFIEGYIHQNIEYISSHTSDEIPVQNKEFIHSNQLCQNIVLDLIIHMFQVQKIQVSMANKSLEDN